MKSFIPRNDRDLARGRRAAAHLRAQGADAMTIAIEQVAVTFDADSLHNRLKQRVETVMRMGADNPEMQARFGWLARDVHGLDVQATLRLIEGLIAAEKRRLELLVRAYGPAPRLPLMILTEARIALRFVRRHRPGEFAAIVRALAEIAPVLMAAE